jgi:hypothetical protein
LPFPKSHGAECQWLSSVILNTWETEIGRIMVWGKPKQTVHKAPPPKITKAKWTGGGVQVVESLLCKYKVLSSNPIPPLQKKGYHTVGIIVNWVPLGDTH